MGYNEGPTKTLIAGEALVAHRRVKLSGATVVYADDEDSAIGVTEYGVASGDPVAVRLTNCGGTVQMEAIAAIAAGAAYYAANDGKADAAGTIVYGYAIEASTASGDIIEVLPS